MTPHDLITRLARDLTHINLTFTTPDTGTEDERLGALEAAGAPLDTTLPGFFDTSNANELAPFWATEQKRLANDPKYWVKLNVREVDPFPLRVSKADPAYYGVPAKLPYVELTTYLFQGDTVTRVER